MSKLRRWQNTTDSSAVPCLVRKGPFPDLLFFSLFFWKKARKTTKRQGFFILANPKNPWERREKRSKKQGIPRKRKKQGISKKQGKEDQGWVNSKTFWSGFPKDILDPYARMPRGEKVSPHHTHICFGADVHDPKGCRKTFCKKSSRLFFAPVFVETSFFKEFFREKLKGNN